MIEVTDLDVRYRDVHAVNGLSLRIMRGEIFGLLGPNGAGKSSTLACIEGLRQPNAGTVRIGGLDMSREPATAKRLLGVQLQTTAMFPELQAIELVELYAALYEVFLTRAECLALLEAFGLGQKARARAEQLSGGQQQRLALALAVVNEPQVVLLDEPTTGLDPQARRGIWGVIRRMQAQGRTVLLTTHSMEEAQELCDRVGIVDAGRMVVLGTPHALIRDHVPALPPEEAARRQPNLEDVFLRLTGRNLVEGTAAVDEQRWLESVAA